MTQLRQGAIDILVHDMRKGGTDISPTGVTGFIGSSGGGVKPTPLLPEEAERLLEQMGMTETVMGEVELEIGEVVEVLEGPFAHFQGRIDEIDYDNTKVKVSVDMFGRETKMELDFNQIRKI